MHRLSVKEQAIPRHQIAAGDEVDAKALGKRGDEDPLALHAGVHAFRVTAGGIRIGALGADGAGLRGQHQQMCIRDRAKRP